MWTLYNPPVGGGRRIKYCCYKLKASAYRRRFIIRRLAEEEGLNYHINLKASTYVDAL